MGPKCAHYAPILCAHYAPDMSINRFGVEPMGPSCPIMRIYAPTMRPLCPETVLQ